GRDLNRHGDYVVDEQGHGGELGDLGPEVLPGHDVGAAGPDVDHHHLAVAEDHQHHHHENDERHRQDDGEGRDPHHRDQRDQDLLRAVGGGGDAVRGEHAQREGGRKTLVAEPLVYHGRAEPGGPHRGPRALLPLARAGEEA